MTNSGTGVDVVVSKGCTNQFLDQIGFFVRTARRRDATDRICTVLDLDLLDTRRCIAERLLPAHDLPRIADLVTDHRCGDSVLMGRIAPCKSPFDTRMSLIGLALFPRHHSNHGVALHFGFEAATYATVGAGCDDAVLGLAQLDDRLFLQSGRRTSFNTSTTRNTVALHEALVLTGRHSTFKATP